MKLDDKDRKLDDWAFEHLPGWLYRVPTRIRSVMFEVKSILQKIFRRNHLSDKEVWNTGSYMIANIHRRLVAFIKTERMGFPSAYADYEENLGWTRDEYDKAKANGNVIGGGKEQWEKDLNEMLFACEFEMNESKRNEELFYKKWKIESPFAKTKENLCESFMGSSDFYYNPTLYRYYNYRAQKGFELLGKNISNLWD